MAQLAPLVAKIEPFRSNSGKPTHMSQEEWDLRVDLAAAYRIVDHLGWSLIIYNHITVRVPGPEHHFLINPYGLRYDEVTATNLVKIDLAGNKVAPSPYDVNPAGFVIHSAIHANVADAKCVMHTHTKEGLAVACKKDGLVNNNFYSAMLFDHVAYHDFEGVTTRLDECERLVKSMGDKPIVILRNHGLLTHGRTVQECFARMLTLQWACEAQMAAGGLPGESLTVSRAATEHSTRDTMLFGPKPVCGVDSFAALQRLIDARDPSYRT
jgi:ribulose-5-phosphate 4-epimerase/fuculose-1-phosphate aldolase